MRSLILEHKISTLDLKIRNNLIDNTFSFETETIQDIQTHNFKINEQEYNSQKSLVIALKNGLVLFDSFIRAISQVQDRLKKVILKILIGESFNQIIEIPSSPIWTQVLQINNMDITKTKLFNPSEFSMVMCQNFFLHLKMLEEIMVPKSRLQDQSDTDYTKITTINKLYAQKLEAETNSDNFSFDRTKISEDIDLVRFWAFLYSNLIVKVYRFFIGNIESLTFHGTHQMRMDIEYVVNVLQNFSFLGRVNQFDSVMKALDQAKPEVKLNLKDML